MCFGLWPEISTVAEDFNRNHVDDVTLKLVVPVVSQPQQLPIVSQQQQRRIQECVFYTFGGRDDEGIFSLFPCSQKDGLVVVHFF